MRQILLLIIVVFAGLAAAIPIINIGTPGSFFVNYTSYYNATNDSLYWNGHAYSPYVSQWVNDAGYITGYVDTNVTTQCSGSNIPLGNGSCILLSSIGNNITNITTINNYNDTIWNKTGNTLVPANDENVVIKYDLTADRVFSKTVHIGTGDNNATLDIHNDNVTLSAVSPINIGTNYYYPPSGGGWDYSDTGGVDHNYRVWTGIYKDGVEYFSQDALLINYTSTGAQGFAYCAGSNSNCNLLDSTTCTNDVCQWNPTSCSDSGSCEYYTQQYSCTSGSWVDNCRSLGHTACDAESACYWSDTSCYSNSVYSCDDNSATTQHDCEYFNCSWDPVHSCDGTGCYWQGYCSPANQCYAIQDDYTCQNTVGCYIQTGAYCAAGYNNCYNILDQSSCDYMTGGICTSSYDYEGYIPYINWVADPNAYEYVIDDNINGICATTGTANYFNDYPNAWTSDLKNYGSCDTSSFAVPKTIENITSVNNTQIYTLKDNGDINTVGSMTANSFIGNGYGLTSLNLPMDSTGLIATLNGNDNNIQNINQVCVGTTNCNGNGHFYVKSDDGYPVVWQLSQTGNLHMNWYDEYENIIAIKTVFGQAYPSAPDRGSTIDYTQGRYIWAQGTINGGVGGYNMILNNSGNLIINTGGTYTFTDNGNKLQVYGTGYIQNNLSLVNGNILTGASLNITNINPTSATKSMTILLKGNISNKNETNEFIRHEYTPSNMVNSNNNYSLEFGSSNLSDGFNGIMNEFGNKQISLGYNNIPVTFYGNVSIPALKVTGALNVSGVFNETGGSFFNTVTTTGKLQVNNNADIKGNLTVSSNTSHSLFIGQDTTSPTYNIISFNNNASYINNVGFTGGGGTDGILYIEAVDKVYNYMSGALKASLDSKGNYNISGNYSAAGALGITKSGTSCTITNITGGIITGATCI